MRGGIVILNVAAFVWLVAALGALAVPPWAYAMPVALSTAIGWYCLSRAGEGSPPPAVARRIWRAVGLWSAVEAILIAIAIAALVRLDRPELIAPAIALIVGLHFIALGRALALPVYYRTGAALVGIAVASVVLPLRPTLVVAGIGAAAALLATSLALIRRPHR